MIQYEIGMFFALGGMAIHAGVIIIAGRSAALALKYAKRLPVQAHLNEEKSREKQQRLEKADAPEAVTGSSSDSDDGDMLAPHVATNASEGHGHPTPSGPSTSSTINNELFLKPKPQPPPPFSKEAQTPITPVSPVPSLMAETAQILKLSDFHRFLKTCESLQLMGTATFFLGVMVLIFIMFFNRVFAILLLVGCVVSSCLTSWIIGFWQVSATKQLFSVAAHYWRRWRRCLGVDVGALNADNSTPKKKVVEKTDGAKKAARRWSATASLSGVRWQDVDIEKGQVKDEKSA